jgi:hypothetical protein
LAARIDRTWARRWYVLIAVLGTFFLLIQLAVSLAQLPQPPAGRFATYIGLFPVQATILMVVASALMAHDPDRDTLGLRVVYLDGLLGVFVTGAIYLLVLGPVVRVRGWEVVSHLGLHYLVPMLLFGGWVMVGPRGRYGRHEALLALIWPLAWFGWTYLYGGITGRYPYPFIDAQVEGYMPTFVRVVSVLAVLFLLAVAVAMADRRIVRLLDQLP